MRSQAMDTSEPPVTLETEVVNGAHVITTTLDTPVLTPKAIHVAPSAQVSEQSIATSISNNVSHQTTTAIIETRIPFSSVQILPFPPSPSSSSSSSLSSSSSNQIFIPRTSQNKVQKIPIQNEIVPNLQGLEHKQPTAIVTLPSGVVLNNRNNVLNCNPPSNNVGHNHLHQHQHHTSQQQQIQLIPQQGGIPLSEHQISIMNHGRVSAQDTIAVAVSQGNLSTKLIQNHLPNHPLALTQASNVSTTHANIITRAPSLTTAKDGTDAPPSHPHPHPQATEPNKSMKISPSETASNSIEPPGKLSENARLQKAVEAKHQQQNGTEDCSDTDMEIMSLDLTSRVNLADVGKSQVEKERPRPMSWEGDLSQEQTHKSAPHEEEQMRVEPDEPMSPMSPMSPSSDTEQDHLPTQVKSELPDDHTSPAPFTTHSLSQTDSPVPARSDSGCELHLGPYTPSQSPLLPRIHAHPNSPTHHLYSPTQSPGQSRHFSGFSSPYSHSPSTGLSRNNSDASQYGGSYNSYSSAPSPISPTHYSPSQSPNLGRVIGHYPGGGGHIYGGPLDLREHHSLGSHLDCPKEAKDEDRLAADLAQHSVLAAQSGITRQQLINSPCPICGDKISGFHYGIFSCESCKGFFKRTVQNKKNYVCMRGSSCHVSIGTRKKCPACRFDKCLTRGMKLEAIREDRTRGGRSTYQCAPYTLPPSLVSPSSSSVSLDQARISDAASVKSEPQEGDDIKPSSSREKPSIPLLLQQIHDVEHLWHCREGESPHSHQSDSMAREAMASDSTDCLNNMCKIADGRLYKIVKWCKSLPLFRHISIDDQIILLMNSWCELLLLSCCFRSVDSPGEIRVSSGRTMTQGQADVMGIGPCVERMLNLSYQLRRLQVDKYEYMAMKVIVLLTSDVAGLEESEKVQYSQEKVVQALQEYTLSHYPHLPNKFGELLLRIPELQRTCHASKEMLSVKKKEGDVPSFNFLFELLRGDH